MENWKKRSVDLIASLFLGAEGGGSVVPYYPQKYEISGEERRYFVRTSPERQGISSKRICAMLSELEGEKRANIHNLLILRYGQVICECSRAGYGSNIFHLSHSMSKSVTSLLLGTLYDEGRLDLGARVADIFSEIEYRDRRFRLITVENLLTMRSGVDFSEAGSVTESLWTESYFSAPLKFEPGAKFHYNSMNSYILARVAERLSGESFTDLVKKRIFDPLEIENYLWEKGPEGCEKGGWGLYLSAESWAKLGQTAMCCGEFFGRRIVSEEWIKRSATVFSDTKETETAYGYGYHMWASEEGEMLYNGMLGQNVWIWQKGGIVAVVQSGNNEMFSDSAALAIIRKYLFGEINDTLRRSNIKALRRAEQTFLDNRASVRPKKRSRGIKQLFGIGESTAYDERWEGVLGSYAFAPNSLGLLPLFVRGMQNNLNSFIEKIRLYRRGRGLYLSVTESGVEYNIRLGLYGYEEAVLDFRGEKYIVKTLAEAKSQKNGGTEFLIELLFPELPNTRMISIRKYAENKIKVSFSESPDGRAINEILSRMPDSSPLISFVFGILSRGLGEDFLLKRTEEAFSPSLIGVNSECADFERELFEEGAGARKRARAGKLLRLINSRLFGSGGKTSEQRAERRAFFAELFELIRASDEKENKDKK